MIKSLLLKLYYWLLNHVYYSLGHMWFRWRTGFDIADSNETLDYIIRHRVSVSRYGDGEYYLIFGKRMGFQKTDPKLGERLYEVLNKEIPRHIVCLPYFFREVSHVQNRTQNFWRSYCTTQGGNVKSVTPRNRKYLDAHFTRFYMDLKDKSQIGRYVEKFKLIWQDREVYIIEGTGTRFGVNNDFLDNAKSIHRILGPATNAFDRYDEILSQSVALIPKDALVLVALGMTATVLAYDLTKEGYQAIDIGHADLEYMWYLMKVDHKVPIEGKNVNELGINDVGESEDQQYLSEIIYRIQ